MSGPLAEFRRVAADPSATPSDLCTAAMGLADPHAMAREVADTGRKLEGYLMEAVDALDGARVRSFVSHGDEVRYRVAREAMREASATCAEWLAFPGVRLHATDREAAYRLMRAVQAVESAEHHATTDPGAHRNLALLAAEFDLARARRAVGGRS